MFKNKLQYMMSNNPDETISKKGSNIRKKIRPYFVTILKLGNKLKLVVEKNEFKKIERPIIYVASHGFKDDVLNTLLTLKDDAYVVFGNIDLFYNTFDGLCLWIYGTQLVNRYDKDSKHAMKNKMDRIIEYGNNIIIFSEATWNLSPNKLMEKLHWGFYDTAIKNNALIVPIVTTKVGKKCYSRVLNSIDLKEINLEEINLIYLTMKKYIEKANDLIIYNDTISNKAKQIILFLKESIETLHLCKTIEESKKCIYKIELISKKYKNQIEELKLEMDEKENLKISTFNLVSKLISRVGMAKKEVMVTKVRDIMASEKYDMYEKNPDYSYMINGKNKYEAWDDCIEDTIKATPYFYPEPEATTLFKDPLINDIEEVMPWLNKTPKTKRLSKK